MPELYDVVRILQDLPDLHLRAGDAGTVVMVFSRADTRVRSGVRRRRRPDRRHARAAPEQIEAAEPG